ncbi:MAG: OmpA family protein [Verrucomicrobiales bacterium]
MNKTQALTFFGVIIAGLGISLFTLNQCGKQVEVVGIPSVDPAVNQTTPETPGTGTKPTTPGDPAVTPETPGNKPAVAPVKIPASFASADALLSAMSESVKNRDADTFLKIAGPDAATPLVQAQVSKLIKDTNFEIDDQQPSTQIAKVAGSFSRWAIRLKPVKGVTLPEGAPKIAEIYTDVIEKKGAGWDVSKIALPLEVTAFLGTTPIAKVNMPAVDPATPTTPGTPATPANKGNSAKPNLPAAAGIDAPDALTVAHAFSKAVVDKNFKLARDMTDTETISDERVAALMIAIEEGKFGLRKQEPLVVTLNRESIVWVLTRIESGSADGNSEFALEMAKTGDDWKINGLAFNALLTALADRAGAGGTAYAPMVKNPQGGESLVVYFDFDKDGVTSRANKQLGIIASILKSDASRKIRINGHADALGTDQYNETLSDGRSAAIRKALVAAGVNNKQIITEAFGETRPQRPNFKNDGTDDPSGRSQNRRAEVYLDF